MRRWHGYLLLLLVFSVSCSDEIDGDSQVLEDLQAGDVVMNMPEVTFDVESRVVSNVEEETGLDFKWSSGDKVAVYSSEGGLSLFSLTSGEGTGQAVFSGQGFSLKEGETYYAYYPFDGNATDLSNLTIRYDGRSISKAGSTQKLDDYAFMAASAVADADGHASFSFNHLSSFARIRLKMPSVGTFTSIDLIPTYDPLVSRAKFNLGTGASTATASSSVVNVPLNDVKTTSANQNIDLWLPFAPQNVSDMAVIVNSSDGLKYSARLGAKHLDAGKAFRWSSKAEKWTSSLTSSIKIREKAVNLISNMPSGQYSGITPIGDDKYAVVHDKAYGGGIYVFSLKFSSDGLITKSSCEILPGTSESGKARDPEGIVYISSSAGENVFLVSGEGDQSILEYDMDGRPTGNSVKIPEDMKSSAIASNYGFEALAYNANTGLIWTTTESSLPKDSDISFSSGKLLRLQSFTQSDYMPAERYFYMTDAPEVSSPGNAMYAFGVPDMLALDDGRLIVMEREAYALTSGLAALGSFTRIKLYLVDPVSSEGGILSKSPLLVFTTPVAGWANYEGMCFGPELNGKKTVLLINDSQDRYSGVLGDYIKVLTFE